MSRTTISMSPAEAARRQHARRPYEPQPGDDTLIVGVRAIAAHTSMTPRSVSHAIRVGTLPGIIKIGRRRALSLGQYRKALHELASL